MRALVWRMLPTRHQARSMEHLAAACSRYPILQEQDTTSDPRHLQCDPKRTGIDVMYSRQIGHFFALGSSLKGACRHGWRFGNRLRPNPNPDRVGSGLDMVGSLRLPERLHYYTGSEIARPHPSTRPWKKVSGYPSACPIIAFFHQIIYFRIPDPQP